MNNTEQHIYDNVQSSVQSARSRRDEDVSPSQIQIDGLDDDDNHMGSLSKKYGRTMRQGDPTQMAQGAQGTQSRTLNESVSSMPSATRNINQQKHLGDDLNSRASQPQMTTFRTIGLDADDDQNYEDINLNLNQRNNRTSQLQVADQLNMTQTNELLNVEHDKVDQFLQQMYYSQKCQYFYIGLLVTCCILILITIIDGFKIAKSPMFIVSELLLNLIISIDFGFRVKMAGLKNYLMRNKIWNKLDFVIVVACNILFIFSILNHVTFGEISEEFLLVAWSVAQSLRMLVIARKQRQAIRSAKQLIDFTNIGFDTEAMEQQARRNEQAGVDLEEVIVFEDHKSRMQQQNQGIQMTSSNFSQQRGKSGSFQSSSKLQSMMERQKSLNRQRTKHRTSDPRQYSDDDQDNQQEEGTQNRSSTDKMTASPQRRNNNQNQQNYLADQNDDTINTDRYAL